MKVIKQQQGTQNFVIKGEFGNVIGEIPRQRGEHIDDFKARAEKARRETEQNRKS